MSLWEKIKLLFAARKAAKEVSKMNLKSSFLSGEFWSHILVIVGLAEGALHGILPPAIAAKIGAVLVSAFAIYRTALKLAQIIAAMTKSTKDDEIVAKLSTIDDLIQGKFPGVVPVEPVEK
jgi:hypothetical protein